MFKKIWTWIKEHLGMVLSVIGVLFAYLLGRRSINGRGGDSAGEIVDDCKKGIERAEEQNKRVGEQLDRSKEIAGGIADNNRRAEEQIDNALDILKKARARTEDAEVLDGR